MNLSNGMLRVVKYDIVRGAGLKDLVEKVCALIDEGWQPHGTPTFVDSSFWYQSVVMYLQDSGTHD